MNLVRYAPAIRAARVTNGGENADQDASRKESNYDREETPRYWYGASVRDPRSTFGTTNRTPGDVRATIRAAHQVNLAARTEAANNFYDQWFANSVFADAFGQFLNDGVITRHWYATLPVNLAIYLERPYPIVQGAALESLKSETHCR